MSYSYRPLTAHDEPLLWEMLTLAAHEPSVESVLPQPCLRHYVEGWGRAHDLGIGAFLNETGLPVGAAWVRLFPAGDPGFGYVDAATPELAMAVLPDHRGRGVGSTLLSQLLAQLRESSPRYPGVCLNVRETNPAVRLYRRAGFEPIPGSEIVNRTGGISSNMLHRFPG